LSWLNNSTNVLSELPGFVAFVPIVNFAPPLEKGWCYGASKRGEAQNKIEKGVKRDGVSLLFSSPSPSKGEGDKGGEVKATVTKVLCDGWCPAYNFF
jgi:hypothetical protein